MPRHYSQRRQFTEDELKYLRQNYRSYKSGKLRLTDMANHLNRAPGVVYNKLTRMMKHKNSRAYVQWTGAQERYLIDNVHMKTGYLARELGLTKLQVIGKVYRLRQKGVL